MYQSANIAQMSNSPAVGGVVPEEATTTGQSGLTLTPSEATMFFAVLKHNKNKLEVDWDLVAQETNLKNAGVSRTRFGQIKRKHGIVIGEGTSSVHANISAAAVSFEGPTPEGTPTKGLRTPRKRAAPSGSSETKTPRKKGRIAKSLDDGVDNVVKKEEDYVNAKKPASSGGGGTMSDDDRLRANTGTTFPHTILMQEDMKEEKCGIF